MRSMRIPFIAALGVLVTSCQSADERKIEEMLERKVGQSNLQIAELGEPYIYRATDDARMACLTIRLKNQWGELQPEQRVIAWYIPRADDWFTDNFRPVNDGMTCEEYVDPERQAAEQSARLQQRAAIDKAFASALQPPQSAPDQQSPVLQGTRAPERADRQIEDAKQHAQFDREQREELQSQKLGKAREEARRQNLRQCEEPYKRAWSEYNDAPSPEAGAAVSAAAAVKNACLDRLYRK